MRLKAEELEELVCVSDVDNTVVEFWTPDTGDLSLQVDVHPHDAEHVAGVLRRWLSTVLEELAELEEDQR